MSENVTVLIANHNYFPYLDKAIKSAINQTVKPSAICVVDDCSNDGPWGSWELICRWTENNQREEQTIKTPKGDMIIRVGSVNDIDIIGIRCPVSSGPSTARNIGIQLTLPSTSIYAILDADDEMLPNKLEECLKPFKDERVGVVYANYHNINSVTGTSILEIKEPFDLVRLNQECIVHSGSLIRASILDKVKDNNGWYDQTMRTCEDWELWLRLSNVCMFYHIPLALTNVLVHPNNSTNSVNRDIWNRNWQYIRDKHFGGQS